MGFVKTNLKAEWNDLFNMKERYKCDPIVAQKQQYFENLPITDMSVLKVFKIKLIPNLGYN